MLTGGGTAMYAGTTAIDVHGDHGVNCTFLVYVN